MTEIRSAVRYVLVGLGLFALDVSVFLALVTGLSVEVPLAQLVSRSVGAATGFAAHKYVTFAAPRQARSAAIQGTGYTAVTLLNLAVSPVIVLAFTRLIPWSLVVAKIGAECVMLAETFLLLRWVFAPRKDT